MVECSKCGKDKSSSEMFDVVSKEGIVKICSDCIKNEDLPVIRRPTTFQLKEAETPSGVYERLSRMAGVNPNEHFKKFHKEELKRREAPARYDVSLRDLVDRKLKSSSQTPVMSKASTEDMISNFHWIIMRARRMKKLTQEQLAHHINESKAAIEMAEKGVLPYDSYKFVRKLEGFLNIRILKKDARESFEGSKSNPVNTKNLRFDDFTTNNLTIEDLRNIKAQHDTDLIQGEIEEDIKLNEEGAEALKEEGKKKGFFSRFFGGSKSKEEKEKESKEKKD